MTEEIKIVTCPKLNNFLATSLMRDARKGIFSNQSPSNIDVQVMIKFVDNNPKEIMCPRYTDGKCNIHFNRSCTFASWSILKVIVND